MPSPSPSPSPLLLPHSHYPPTTCFLLSISITLLFDIHPFISHIFDRIQYTPHTYMARTQHGLVLAWTVTDYGLLVGIPASNQAIKLYLFHEIQYCSVRM
ncbi:hypothetical protein B0H16DRAFT_1522367 [Mycena metata]|uniref:Uncharacterized protein n=1 Tax=Mycena metata TaxID=1033252 RepID=A0AAD7JN02_9AGAR|nr:hypothetical protein B0H16DRAFT_1522367 [Mycena metata]